MLYLMYFALSVIGVFLAGLTISLFLLKKKKALERATVSLLIAMLGAGIYYTTVIQVYVMPGFAKKVTDVSSLKIETKSFREKNVLTTCKVRQKEKLSLQQASDHAIIAEKEDPLAAWRLLQEKTEYYDCVESPYNVVEIIETDLCKDKADKVCENYATYKSLFKNRPWFEESLDTLCRTASICFNPKELPACDQDGEPKRFCCSIGSTYNHSYKACIPDKNIVSVNHTQSENDEDPLVTLRGCAMPICNTGNGPDGTGVNTNGHWIRRGKFEDWVTAYHYKDVGLIKK